MSLRDDLLALMAIPGLSGHEDRVRAWIRSRLSGAGIDSRSDRLGNLVATLPGDRARPSVMVFAHMDQLGFVVRRIDPSGLLRLERLGGVPERALAAQAVTVGDGIPGVIGHKSHHATPPDDKYRVIPYADLFVDCGFASKGDAEAAGIRIGTPVTYAPRAIPLAGGRIAGTSIDDRAGCAVLIALAEALATRADRPTIHAAFTVQEEFNLRGAAPLAADLAPDIALQIDLMLATDTPDMEHRGEMRLGGGPGISLYSFHGRGTLNGVIPHPALVALVEDTAAAEGIPLQRSAQTGVLTDLSYVQLTGRGVAALDLGFPMRYSHSALEVCDMADLDALAALLAAMLPAIGPDFPLERHP